MFLSYFAVTPFDKISVVVVGQDPYHGPGQAHGLAFSVMKGVQVPPSLLNMYKELEEDPNITFKRPGHGYLEKWATQGVLMLNTCLTVRKGEPNSHSQFHPHPSFPRRIFRVLPPLSSAD